MFMSVLTLTTPLDALNEFPLNEASVALWTFKKSQKVGETAPTFTGRWVETTEQVNNALKTVALSERERITETHDYGLLSQNNEASALTISTIETHVGLVIDQAMDEIESKKVNKIKHLENTEFYALKFVAGRRAVYAVKKVDGSWKTKKALNAISVFFDDDQLDLSTDRSFILSKSIDFFIIDDVVMITNKLNFESVLSYKQAYKEEFISFQEEPDFVTLFSDMTHIISYVGDNKIHLRRVLAIKQKGHYKNPIFMDNLRTLHGRYGLNINFDNRGKIVPCLETCRDIFVSLLDHRLISPFNPTNVYDVQNTDQVEI